MSQLTGTRRGGRPRKDLKVHLGARVRQSVKADFRRFVGPERIFNEMVERALIHEMQRRRRA